MARPRITVVGLGPAGPDLVTAGTLERIDATPVGQRVLRTARHPSAGVMGRCVTCDDIYESATRLDEVYPAIVERLVDAAAEHGEVLYAVPGSPAVAERTVVLLRDDDRAEVDVEPALSFLDLAWARLGVDPLATSPRLVDGQRFAVEAAGQRGPLLVAQCDSTPVLSEVKLAIGDALDATSSLGGGLARPALGPVAEPVHVTVLQRLGLPDEHIITVDWDELDRAVVPDHLTSLWVPALAAPVAAEVQRFAELVATLRRDCPWDREQTHQSLERHLLEEAYEVLDALEHLDVETGEGYGHLEEELGDLLFQVLFHATLAAEEGQFTLADVARTVHDKLYSRHPHVFGDVPDGLAPGETPEQVAANWEQLKKAEKGRSSVFDGVPDALPALLYALKVQKKAASLGELGADLPAPAKWDPVVTAARRSPSDATIGDLLFAVVSMSRRHGVDPEMALRAAANRYRDVVRQLEH